MFYKLFLSSVRYTNRPCAFFSSVSMEGPSRVVF